jgi:hypothetical protein
LKGIDFGIREAAVFDEVLHERSGVAAEGTVEEIGDDVFEDAIWADRGGIDIGAAFTAGFEVTFGFEAAEIGLDGEEVELPVGGKRVDDLADLSGAEGPDNPADFEFGSGECGEVRHVGSRVYVQLNVSITYKCTHASKKLGRRSLVICWWIDG